MRRNEEHTKSDELQDIKGGEVAVGLETDGESSGRTRDKVGKKNPIKSQWRLILLILPAVLFFIIFHYGPMYGVQIAFKDYMPSLGIWGSPWVGFKHCKLLCQIFLCIYVFLKCSLFIYIRLIVISIFNIITMLFCPLFYVPLYS